MTGLILQPNLCFIVKNFRADEGNCNKMSLGYRGEFVLRGVHYLLAVLSLCFIIPVSSLTSLSRSSRLNVGETLLSPAGHMELGFFEFSSGKYRLAIRYAAPIQEAVTWVANRDVALSKHSYLYLADPSGDLQVFDPASDPTKPSWSSSSANLGVEKALLLDGGNLVLTGANNKLVWDSFKDAPSTDTLLPGQYLHKAARHNLTSWRTAEDPSTGLYSFGWGGANASTLQLAWRNPNTYMNWTGGAYIPAPDVHNPRTLANVNSTYFHFTLGQLYVVSSPADTAILTGGEPSTVSHLKRITLDTDGGLRVWQWQLSGVMSKAWEPVANWVLSERPESKSQCTVFGTCGSFGWCTSKRDSLEKVQCKCPFGFKAINERDMTQGCTEVVPLTGGDCNNTAKVRMEVLEDVDMPWGGDYFNLTGADAVRCEEACLQDCECAGAVYSETEKYCWMKQAPLLCMGYPTVALHGMKRKAFIKVAILQPAAKKNGSAGAVSKSLWLIVGVPVAGVPAMVVVVILIFRCIRRRRLPPKDIIYVFSGPSEQGPNPSAGHQDSGRP